MKTLKRWMIVIVLSLVLAPAAFPDEMVKPLSFGLKGGINYSNMTIDQVGYPEGDNFLRFGGGLTLGTMMQPSLGFDIDLLYLQKGTTFEYPGLVGMVTYEFTFEYVVVSPMLRIAPGRGGAGIYFLAGPEIGYLIKATNHGEREGAEADWDITDSFKDLDLSLTAGLGFQTASAGRSSFFLEGRYTLGLTDIADTGNSGDELDTGDGIKTRGIYLFAGIRF